jgi:hypothetical protein
MRFAQPDSPAGAPDPGQGAPRGPRLPRGPRGRRALMAAGGAVVTGAAAAVAVITIGPSGQSPHATLAALAKPGAAATGRLTPSPRPTRTPAPVPSPSPTSRPARPPVPVPAPSRTSPVPVPSPGAAAGSRPEGKVIDTGIRDARGELVLWVVKVSDKAIPQTHFGVMAGHRTRGGKLIPGVMTNEFSGPDDAPGFHAVESPTGEGQPTVNFPEFGYYAGPAATITGQVHGSGPVLRAATAHWSLNRSIVLFWFPPRTNPRAGQLTNLSAADAHGNPLPSGHNNPGVG